MSTTFMDNIFLLLVWVALICALLAILGCIADKFLDKFFPYCEEHDDSLGGTMEDRDDWR